MPVDWSSGNLKKRIDFFIFLSKQDNKIMNAKILTTIQFISLIVMIGTAEELFASLLHTLLFSVSFIAFAQCSIYIGKNEKWLTRKSKGDTLHYN